MGAGRPPFRFVDNRAFEFVAPRYVELVALSDAMLHPFYCILQAIQREASPWVRGSGGFVRGWVLVASGSRGDSWGCCGESIVEGVGHV